MGVFRLDTMNKLADKDTVSTIINVSVPTTADIKDVKATKDINTITNAPATNNGMQMLNSFSPKQIRVIMGCLMLSFFLAWLDTSIVVVCLPVIVGDLGPVLCVFFWLLVSMQLSTQVIRLCCRG